MHMSRWMNGFIKARISGLNSNRVTTALPLTNRPYVFGLPEQMIV